jgi:lipoyl-dependent peroxiredoxin
MIMAVRNADAHWAGTLKEGTGTLKLGSGAFEGQYNFTSRFEEGTGTNPEELLGAAHAGCFTMALNAALERSGTTPNYVHTAAKVHIRKNDAGQNAIMEIELLVDADVPGLSNEDFQKVAEDTKTGCIISRALNVPTITLNATLK